ncbi:RES family NAD+ phosphorylase [Gordonia sp. DT219]|uniref:RES family NAD+ phosphorylase n=1 Tax=Gordonia sp. DT219 TaxID=3416658 RepID=UPI003CF26FF6
MTGRDAVALRGPDGHDLSTFPTTSFAAGVGLYRAHRTALGAWYFSAGGAGRFDLDPPRGTCYLATDTETAVRETLGSTLHTLGGADVDFAAQRSVSRLRLPTACLLADLCDRHAADFGITREIHTITPYTVTRAWAEAFDAVSDGLLYQSRFTTVAQANALAVFDDAGPKSWPADTTPIPFLTAARAAGITILPPPRRVTIVPPPT